ncbi:MAG: transporter substrate-binding domain-containing protein, partial [Lachnospiraceae bacterium]|nr:transporter substrate-binding domain-containing protein [Lachnospiraceae bacterium]
MPMEKDGTKNIFKQKGLLFAVSAVILFAMSAVIVFAVLWIQERSLSSKTVRTGAKNSYDTGFTAVADASLAPFSYVDRYGRNQGFCVELVNELSNRMKMNVTVKLTGREEARRQLRDGEADVLLYFDELSQTDGEGLILTSPAAELDYAVYGKNRVYTVSELYGKKTAAVKGDPLPDLGLNSELTLLPSYEKLFAGLSRGEYAYGICPAQIGERLLSDSHITGLRKSHIILHSYCCFALKEQNGDLRNKLNIALNTMHREGAVSALSNQWIGTDFEHLRFMSLCRAYPFAVTLFLFLLLYTVFMIVYAVWETKEENAKIQRMKHILKNIHAVDRHNIRLESRFEKLDYARLKAESANTSKTIFLTNMAREVRKPVSEIADYSQEIDDMMSSQVADEILDSEAVLIRLQNIRRRCRMLTGLMNDILEMARFERGQVRLNEGTYNVYSILDGIDGVVSSQADQKNQRLLMRSTQVQHAQVTCDKLRLSQALLNVVQNAVKFTQKDGEIRVTLTELKQERKGYGVYEFRVKDNGIGMEAGFLERLYEPFQTGGNSPECGAGLGLSITKSIVDLMGGTIKVETTLQRGTEFTLRFSFKLPDQAADPKEEVKRKREAAANPGFAGQRILAVENPQFNAVLIADILRDYKLSVTGAQNGAEAL